MTPTKTCIYCGAEFAKKPRNSWAEWEARKVCSRSCRPSPADRLWAQVDRGGPDDCWPWHGGPTSSKHGAIRTPGRRSRPVHALAYELLVGPIAPGLEVHHKCQNPICCNPAHMELLTHSAHAALTQAERNWPTITHCPRGHAYEENGYRNQRGSWVCRICQRAHVRAYQQRQKAAGIKRTPVRRDRVCGRCGEFKRADEFHVGNATYCATCKTEESRQWRLKRKVL